MIGMPVQIRAVFKGLFVRLPVAPHFDNYSIHWSVRFAHTDTQTGRFV